MNLELIGIIGTILAVMGVYLNNHKYISCFYLFIVSNSMALYIHYDLDIQSFMLRDVIFISLAIHGWWKWRKK